ncbi:MAG TPA: hypothetical protein PLA74_00900 [Syntrophales bacterium]|nr:hypothetical protein [Syntrophales bacterium]HPQ45000.1 hypothetical protein [Syntrophales bacterium]
MNDERSELTKPADQVDEGEQCGPGCNCGRPDLGMKKKVIICLIVVIAAAAVLAQAYIRKVDNKPAQRQEAYTAPLVTTAPADDPSTVGKTQEVDTNQVKSSPWDEPLKSFASLNEVAADKEAVFVYLPEKGKKQDQNIQKEIEAATNKVRAGKTVVAFYTLSDDSQDYEQMISKVPAPCVVAMVNGRGISLVSGEITEGKLLQALVAASRPSGCSLSGCDPSSSGCK